MMNSDCCDTYRKEISELYEKTDGRFEHAEERAIELFDTLLEKGFEIHCDKVKRLCLKAGYDEPAAQEIATIYDVVVLYRKYKARQRRSAGIS